MKRAPTPSNEAERQKALDRYHILDTAEERIFDDVTEIASQICGTPVALISLIDRDRQWFKSHLGLDARETPRDVAFCAHAIFEDAVFEIRDSRLDERFHDNPIVVNDPKVVFYAGAPLTTSDGYRLGTLCVIDHEPKELSIGQTKSLEALARQVVELFEAKRAFKDLELHKTALANAARLQALGQLASGIAHEINNPLSIISAQVSILVDRIQRKPETLLSSCQKELDRVLRTVDRISKIVRGLKTFARNGDQDPLESVDIVRVVDDAMAVAAERIKKLEVSVRIVPPAEGLASALCACRPVQIGQVVMNLLSNALDAVAERPERWIEIYLRAVPDQPEMVELVVRDSGTGIDPKTADHMLEPFFTTKPVGQGTGLGLSISHGIAKSHGGDLFYELDRGHTAFVLRLPTSQVGNVLSA